jgi:hypothetical protein
MEDRHLDHRNTSGRKPLAKIAWRTAFGGLILTGRKPNVECRIKGGSGRQFPSPLSQVPDHLF